ncbi:MAG: peptidase E [Thermoleophilia bacterium]|nr:peptidase E [Thermoleophilia bacterium]
MPERRIVAMGGRPDDALLDHVLGLARGRRVLYVPTAGMEDASFTVWWYGRLRDRAAMRHLHFSPWPPRDLRAVVLEHDLVLVAGGNTASMLAIWRVHGFDRVLADAWREGVLLTGWSAGAICWFEAGVTDSFGPQLEGMRDGLGLLPGSACPHYDGEPLRRPRYAELVSDGFPAGIALDDAAAAVFAGTELAGVVASREGSTAYRVAAEGEEPLRATVVG